MARWLVCATRDASEDAAAVVEAADELEAEDKFSELHSKGELVWEPGESGNFKYDCYSVEQVGDDQPLGVRMNEAATQPALLAAAKQVIAWGDGTGGWEAPCWKALRAAVDKAEGGSGGWVLIDVDGSGLCEIEKDDNDSDIFDTDAEALAYVRTQAEAGNVECALAIARHEHDAGALVELRREKAAAG